jgi:transcriptional regulator with XRE-family HTH domain
MPTKPKTSRNPHANELRRLGERLSARRHQAGLTQASLAEAMDISVAYVSLLERGGRNPPYTTVVALARALGVPLAKLIAE